MDLTPFGKELFIYIHVIDHMHMTSQKGAPVVLGVKRGTPRAPSPSMHSEGKPLHASPPSWPGCAHWLRGWAPMRSASKTCARSATSLDPQHGVVVMETWRQCIRSILYLLFTYMYSESEHYTQNDTLVKFQCLIIQQYKIRKLYRVAQKECNNFDC